MNRRAERSPPLYHDPMDALLKQARSAGVAVLLTDHRIHRRGHVHYIFWPDRAEPVLADQLTHVLLEAQSRGIQRLWLITHWTNAEVLPIEIPALLE